MLVMLLVSLLTGAYCYVESVKWGMNAKRWAFAAVIFGPLLFPMFGMAKHIHWRRAVGFNNLFFTA